MLVHRRGGPEKVVQGVSRSPRGQYGGVTDAPRVLRGKVPARKNLPAWARLPSRASIRR